jgi:hypothetical protein
MLCFLQKRDKRKYISSNSAASDLHKSKERDQMELNSVYDLLSPDYDQILTARKLHNMHLSGRCFHRGYTYDCSDRCSMHLGR